MELLEKAWGDLRRTPAPVAAYLAVILVLSLAWAAAYWLIAGNLPEEEVRDRVVMFQLIATLAEVLIISAAQAVCFARLGREIDKPLWKCADDAEALRRFFAPWLILNLLVNTLLHLQNNAFDSENDGLLTLLIFLHMALFMVALPTGACIMYHGSLKWEELGQALRPLVSQPPLVVIVLMLMLGQYMLFLTATQLIGSFPIIRYFLTPVNLLSGLLDCLAFAAMWHACMAARNASFYDDSDPWDF